ncbi:hypothetical protein O9929_14405 [Vibrio lentus]|nr:hypothetical protein [Vibrio lentus]
MSNIVWVARFAALQTIKMVRKLDQDIAITMITADAGLEYSKPVFRTRSVRNKRRHWQCATRNKFGRAVQRGHQNQHL